MPRSKELSGAEKRRLKVAADLRKAGDEPSQKKLCFQNAETSATESTVSDSLPQSTVTGIVEVEVEVVEHSLVPSPRPADADRPAECQIDELVLPLPVSVESESHLQQSADDNVDDTVDAADSLASSTSTQSSFIWPTIRHEKLHLLSILPNQPIVNIPFQSDIYYQITEDDDQRIQRKWLMYDSDKRKLYCSVCGCYSTNRLNLLVQGLGDDNFRRASQIVKRHEYSLVHRDASDVYFRDLYGQDIISLTPQWTDATNRLSRQRVERNRQVLDRIIDIIKLIACQGLAYRGNFETARDLLDVSKRHGNFLELVLLLAKYDSILSSHVDSCIEYSQVHSDSRGRGNFVSFLSKTTVNNILLFLCASIQDSIVTTITEECKGKYGVMMDGTVDVSGTDQMSIVLRYVTTDGTVCERLLGLDVIKSGTGEALWSLLSAKLTHHHLEVGNAIGMSLDGASANTSQDVGVVKFYKDNVSNGYFVWGFAHQQNLVVSPVFSEIKDCRNLLGLLQETCKFFNESSRRMDIWKVWTKREYVGQDRQKKLVKVGKTRWWSSFKAVKRVCDQPVSYMVLIGSLWELSRSSDSSNSTRSQSESLLDKWLKFNTVFTAIVLRDVIKTCDPVTKYMQTRGLDITQAVGLVENELKVLSADRSKFDDHLKKANEFCQEVQSLVDSHTNLDFDVTLETTLPESSAPRKKRRMFDEMATDETQKDPIENFRLNTYLMINDRLCQEVSSRFNEKNSALYKELWVLSPKNYVWLCDADVTSFSLKHLAMLSDVDELKLKEELKHTFCENTQRHSQEIFTVSCRTGTV